jgi:hypothetical protein
MDRGTIETLRGNGTTQAEHATLAANVFERLERFVETGEPQNFWFFQREQEFEAFVKLLGITEFDASRILGLAYYSTYDHGFEVEEAEPDYAGSWKYTALLNQIGDRFAPYVEFPNNFRASVAIGYDDDTAVLLSMEVDEQPAICVNCDNDPEYMEHNDKYSCGHAGNDECDYRYQAIVLKKSDLVYLDWDRNELRSRG